MAETNPPAPADGPQPDPALADWPSDFAPKIIRFEELARCGEEVWIEHNRQLYRLRRTRQGKLILTK